VTNHSAARQPSSEWRGRFFEDFRVGDIYRSRLGRTLTETDNIWFTTLTMNTNQMHFNEVYARRTELVSRLWSPR
jgi:itaconyl-CoA hydratase